MFKYIVISILILTGCASSHKPPPPPPKPVPPAHPAAKKYFIRVKKGDTLYSIAWKAGLNYKKLARWNHLKPPYTIYPGQVLRLFPDPKTKKAPPPRSSRPAQPKPKKKLPIKIQFIWPVKGSIIAQFKRNDPIHKGIEIAGQIGQTVHAAADGEVVYVGQGLSNYGQVIIIKHRNNYLSGYGYNHSVQVKEGQWVKQGQAIAKMGQKRNGQAALYFEIRHHDQPVNPIRYLPH